MEERYGFDIFYIYTHTCTLTCTRVWRLEGYNLWELILSLYYVGTRDGTQVVRLSSKPLYLVSHLIGPEILITYIQVLRFKKTGNKGKWRLGRAMAPEFKGKGAGIVLFFVHHFFLHPLLTDATCETDIDTVPFLFLGTVHVRVWERACVQS